MNPLTIDPFYYTPLVNTAYYQSPSAAASTSPLVSLANGIGSLFENGLNIYASTLNRLRALDIINNDSNQSSTAAATAAAPASDAEKTNNLLLMLILGAVALGLVIWIVRKK